MTLPELLPRGYLMEIAEIKTGPELTAFIEHMRTIVEADTSGVPIYTIHVAVDEDGAKFKVNGHSWTRPFGRKVER